MDTKPGLRVYEDLAEWYERQGQPSMRDRFLVLAADAALAAGRADEAERLRQRLLQVNPHHLLKPYTSFAEALRAADVQTYLRDLRLNYPVDTAQSLLRTLRAESLLESLQEPEGPAKATTANSKSPAPQGEPMKVYRLQEESPRPSKSAVPSQPRNPAPSQVPSTKPRAAPVPRPQPAALPVAPPRPPRPASPVRAASQEGEGTGDGSWFSSLLFGLFFTAGVVLAAYVLARPFLPPDWLR